LTKVLYLTKKGNIMFVRGKGNKNREKILDLLESKGYIIDNEEFRGRDGIINGNLPIGVNTVNKTYNMMGNVTCAAALCSGGGLWEDDKLFEYFEIEEYEKRIHEIEFKISLWEKVELELGPDGAKIVKNATYHDDPLFPEIIVSGYDEVDCCEKTYRLPCYVIISDISKSDWIEEYEETGKTPAYSFPEGVKSGIIAVISNLKADLNDATENLDALKNRKALPEDPDQVIDDLLAYWKEKYAKAFEEWKKAPGWYSKLVDVDISFGEYHRKLKPDDFGFDDAFIENIGNEISADLRKQGATVSIFGMMD